MGIVMGRRPVDVPNLELIKMEGEKRGETSLVSMIQAYLKWRYNSANLWHSGLRFWMQYEVEKWMWARHTAVRVSGHALEYGSLNWIENI